MKCILCKNKIEEKPYWKYGNNPFPLSKKGSCCDNCNQNKVIPARIKLMQVK
jgi:hypothetical protein